MSGLGGIISHFSKACRNQPFTPLKLQQGNQPRGDAILLPGDEYAPGPELDDVFVKPLPEVNLRSPPMWVYFNFCKENLEKLKKQASWQTIVPYITTDEPLCEFIWQRITAVRSSHLKSQTKARFARLFTVRKHFNL
ncbi:hypothetical protein B0O99DRAFT_690119 [Bisporella sp. PMI_857]|nr:hypothetical protein B0O99DRAFT_690119 [Bisporella sp. PMI_857]